MRKRNVRAGVFIGLCVFMLAAVACQSTGAVQGGSAAAPSVQERLKLDAVNRQLGYQLLADGAVAFILDAKAQGIDPEDIDRAWLEGSFNGWLKGTDDAWRMEPRSDGRTWVHMRRLEEVRAPGNSGFPEFKFYILHVNGSVLEPAAASKIPGFQMATNNLLLHSPEEAAYVSANLPLAAAAKPLADFDLSDPEQAAALSNVRLVPGTRALWRGYHPYKMSRPQFDTEATRNELVKRALEDNGIKATIVLSGEEKPTGAESVSAWHQAIIDGGSQLVLNTSYNTVYYRSDSEEFGLLIQRIVRFINAWEGPFYVHCRLGTDRTGAVSGVLAALCGAPWPAIAEDYQKSNRMMIKEFRDYHILQYALERMIGKPIGPDTDLQGELTAYFINNGYLDERDVSDLRRKIGALQ